MDFKLKVPKMKAGEQSMEVLSFTLTMEQDADGQPVIVGRLKMPGWSD